MVAKYAHKENGVRASKTKRGVWSKYNFLKKIKINKSSKICNLYRGIIKQNKTRAACRKYSPSGD